MNVPWIFHGMEFRQEIQKRQLLWTTVWDTNLFLFFGAFGYDSCCGSGGCCPRFWICTACMGLSVSRKHVQQMFMFFWHSTFYRAKSTIRPPFGEFFCVSKPSNKQTQFPCHCWLFQSTKLKTTFSIEHILWVFFPPRIIPNHVVSNIVVI